MSFQTNSIVNATIYLNGNTLLGKASEVDLGAIKTTNADQEALGLFGIIELPTGLDKITGKIVWNSLYPDAIEVTSNPFKSVQLQCRSSISVYTAAGKTEEQSLVTFLTVTFKGAQLGTFKPREATKSETEFSATSVRQLINGKETLMVDYLANIFRINGQDQLDQYRKNLGMT